MIYLFGDYELDTRLYELRQAGQLCLLEPQVFNLLAYLILHRDRVVTRQELFDRLWPDQLITDAALTHRLMTARKAVGDSAQTQSVIKTVRGRGYRFVAAVQERVPETVAASATLSPAEADRRCAVCQHVNGAEALFCEACGVRLVHVCSGCGQISALSATFCSACGQHLGVAVPPELEASTPAAGAHDTRLQASWEALAGERKHVTVLFCTLTNASALAERLGPERLHAVLHRFFDLALRQVQRYDGTITQFLGDGFMALFGVPLADEDHARQAVHAALGIDRALRQGLPTLEAQGAGVPACRMGLHTGQVIVGAIGENGRVMYTAVGDTIIQVARVQQAAAPGTIRLTETTAQLVTGYFQCDETGQVDLGEATAPVWVYQVVGEQSTRSRFDVARARGLTRLVGRERERALLHDRLARVEAGHGQIVGIVGEPGLGKSRLLYEFRAALEPERVAWIEGHCLTHGQDTPYAPILDILSTQCQLAEAETPQQMQIQLRQRVCQLDSTLEDILPLLEALFGFPGADDALRHLEPRDQRRQTFEACRALVIAASLHGPQVLVCENLHWIDPSSEDCLAVLAESLASVSVLVLTTHRPGYTVRWADTPYYTQIALDALTEAETAAMVSSLLGRHDLPSELLRLIQDTARGNPLFIEEATQALLERGVISTQNGGVQWTGEDVTAFPTTIQDIMRARVDRLDVPVKRTVQTAAVIGREFDLRLLARLSGREAKVQQAFEVLKRLELVYETRVFPDVAYCFKHPVIQDVVYQSLLEQQRQELHGAIGLAIEELSPGRREEQAALLAFHYARSIHHEKTIAYALLAGDQAARLHANAEATTYYTQALTTARALSPSPMTQRAQIDATLKLATVGPVLDRDLEHLRQTQPLAEALHDEPRLAQVRYWLGRLHYASGDFPAAVAHAEASLDLADRLHDDMLAAPPVNLLGRVYYMQSDYLRASQMMVRSVDQMRQLGNTTEEASIAAFAGAALAYLGEFKQAFSYANHGLHLAQELQNPFAETAAYHYRGMAYDQYGDWPQAIADYQAARHLADQVGDRFRIYIVQFWEARAYTMAGEPDQGRKLLNASVALAEQLGTTFGQPCQKTFLAACLLALGESEALLQLCDEAIRVATAAGDKLANALAHRTLAAVLADLQPSALQRAESALLAAVRLHKDSNNQPELARGYVDYARFLQRQQKSDEAITYLTRGIDMFRYMGMAWDFARAEQILNTVS
jgi:class 3 adenylate cyclase/DNA-binding winged helix-turn-helix (wHTH) protein/tetratricopeptide (TPR) repeat protein